MRSWRYGLGIGTAAVCLALAAALPASAATASGWHILYRVPAQRDEIEGVTAPATNDAWALGLRYSRDAFKGTFYQHWAGAGWQRAQVPQPAGFAGFRIASSSPDNVWVLGSVPNAGYEALVYNGLSWRAMPAPSNGPVVVLASDDVWQLSSTGCSPSGSGFSCTTQLNHWDGATWTRYTLPVYGLDVAGAGQHVWFTGAADVTRDGLGVANETGREALFQWSGSAWQSVAAPDQKITGGVPAAATPGGKLWLVAQSLHAARPHLDHWNGRRWTQASAPPGANQRLAELSYDGRDGFWDAPDHWTGTEWVRTVPFPAANVLEVSDSVHIPGTTSAWGAVIATRDNRYAIAVYGARP